MILCKFSDYISNHQKTAVKSKTSLKLRADTKKQERVKVEAKQAAGELEW